jgi:hypothetical protein
MSWSVRASLIEPVDPIIEPVDPIVVTRIFEGLADG